MKKSVLLTIIICFSVFSSAQVIAVSGKVTGFHKFPFKNITVKAKKAKTKILTDENGIFNISCFPNDILLFESKSCYSAKYKIKNPGDSIRINLVFKTDEKSKEYAIGYGIIKEEDLIYAISNLNNNDVDFSIYNNIYDLIKGRFPGVEIKGTEIIVRGSSSIMGSNAALLLVDGVKVQDLNHLAPIEVKSIDVLKDAGSTAIYGANGANGVVIITTKK